MKRIFIGHRGVGKSSLLKRHKSYFSEIAHFDLDTEIESREKINIFDFMNKNSEKKFRELEKKIYEQIKSENTNYVMALGAGFQLDHLDPAQEVFFISRATDKDGRIFLNRPRLEPDLSPIAEAIKRYQLREPLFIKKADFVYHMPEGIEEAELNEELYFKKNYKVDQAYYTLAQSEILHLSQLTKCYLKIELRTDLLNQSEILNIINSFPRHQWLVSIRDSNIFQIPESVEIDCDIQFLQNNRLPVQIVSTHQDSIQIALKEIESHQDFYHIKLCPFVENLEQLKLGFEWQKKNSKLRSFLPRSENGKWNWFRLLSKKNQKINFIRNQSQIKDQPTLYQWINYSDQFDSFAAILGNPVHFSRSPITHQKYFKEKKINFLSIELTSEEFTKHMPWLSSLGLVAAAVTSPLKKMAFQISNQTDEVSKRLQSVNTIIIENEKMQSCNTDLQGFQFLMIKSGVKTTDTVAVWGGGGTLEMMKTILPHATYFSSQTGLSRSNLQEIQNEYTILIWAAPRTELTKFPPLLNQIKKVIDLNYVENSMGLEYALLLKSNGQSTDYISGLEMFNEQARKQQEFWSQR